MNKDLRSKLDWGTWLSLSAIAAVALAVGFSVTGDPAEPVAEVAPEPDQAQAAPEEEQPAGKKKDEKKDEKAAPAQAGGGDRLSKPDSTFELPSELNEISGLSASTDPGALWAVHDERGVVFKVSTKDGSILEEIEFSKKADYEGVEEVDGKLYVARSDGVVYIVDPQTKKATELNFSDQVGKKCDVEGMGYEASKKRLLLACKAASTETRKTTEKEFEVFAMDLGTQKLADKPAYAVTTKSIDAYVKAHADRPELKDLKGKDYGPSGLAVHPKTGEVIIISSTGQMAVVLNTKGALIRIHALERSVHSQPEGVAYGADGTLFLSNEARGKTPLLHVFKLPVPTEG